MLLETILNTENQIAYARSKGIRFNEANTKKNFIEPIIEALGWNLRNFEEVDMEYRGTIGGRGPDKPVDYALFIAGSAALFVEAKPLDESLDDKRWIDQTLNYANVSGVRWCVLTNGLEYRIYKTHEPVVAVKKLFRSVMIGRDDANVIAATLSLLRKEEMKESSLDRLWRTEVSDRCVREAAEQLLAGDERFVKLLQKVIAERDEGPERKAEDLDRKAILQSLNRLRPRFEEGLPSRRESTGTTPKPNEGNTNPRSSIERDSNGGKENSAEENIPCFLSKKAGTLHAKGIFNRKSKRLTIKSGAVVANDVAEYASDRIKLLRVKLAAEAKLNDFEPETLILAEDICFDNPCAAAGFVTGTSINGWDEWKLVEGQREPSLQSVRDKKTT